MVNTGWVGGGYGVGERISIKNTRNCINAILDGSINDEFVSDELFRFDVPVELMELVEKSVDQEMLGVMKLNILDKHKN